MDNTFFRESGSPNIRDIIDIPELTELFQSYSDITGMGTGLLDLDGEVLVATNWQDSCTRFHRVNEVTLQRCRESDTALAGSLSKGDHYNVYRCRNGLVDVATPVVIDGVHMANFFIGQFFFEPPDLDFFARQGEAVGFDQEAYLDAIRRVPVHDEEIIKSHMKMLVRIAEMMGKAGAANLRVMQTNRELEQHRAQLQSLVEERTQELQASLRVAESASVAKSRFLANMSHELRTPLNAILGFSEILAAREREPRKKHYLESINLAGKGLLQLINSVLDLSKIEAGKMPVQAVPMSLSSLLQELEVMFSRQAAEKDLDWAVETPADVPKVILFDEIKLRQVLINLAGNALKFTERGAVKIQLQVSADYRENGCADLHLSVIDSGRGISVDDQMHIFTSFEQARDQKISEYGGTGLGLSLCKQLIHLLGGQLTLQSDPGKGSVFHCYFPRVPVLPASEHKVTKQASAWKQPLQFAPATILVVDDNTLNRDVMHSYLSEWDFRVLEAENGRQALALARQYHPDLIFMDMKMPVMDGFEATLQLKADPATQAIPVVAATASALASEKARICEVTDDYLSKPVTFADLVNCLSRFFTPVYSGSDNGHPKKVLVVDDDRINRFLLSDVLEEWGHCDVNTACNGDEAVALSCRPDRAELILMDCEMPGIDGFEAARRIRSWEAENRVAGSTIFIVTAHSAEDMAERQCDILFNGFLKKPLEMEEITELLKDYV